MAKQPKSPGSGSKPALLFDLDGTLIDSVYQHVLAWSTALQKAGLPVPAARIHRKIGMSGGLIVHSFMRETGRSLTAKEIKKAHRFHGEEFDKVSDQVRPLPGARELLKRLSQLKVSWAIATSGNREAAEPFLRLLNVGSKDTVITRDEVSRAKPDPDLFLAAAKKLGRKISDCVVIGDSVWDLLAAQRARALGVGLLAGGFGEDELMSAGAYRVYKDPADLLAHLEEIGIRVDND
jgi:HAD superfamily hydrolase (TIGR01549 family)